MRSGNLFEPPADETYAEVAVPVPAAGTFTYSIPEPARAIVLPGSRVVVPFSGRRLTGIVVATRSRPPAGLAPEKLRPLGDCLDPLPLLSPLLLALTRWIAEETMSSWGEAIRTALPAGLERVARRRVALTEDGRALLGNGAGHGRGEPSSAAKGGPELPDNAAAGSRERRGNDAGGRRGLVRSAAAGGPESDDLASAPPAGTAAILKTLGAARGGTMSFTTLARQAGKVAGCARLYELARRGLVAIDDEWAAGVGGRWREVVVAGRQVTLERAREATARAPVQRRAVESLWEMGTKGAAMPIDELCAAADCTPATIRALAGKRLVEIRRQAMADDPAGGWSGG
ncbi:MAG TPA: hypothetical protein VGC93_16410, partial [Thermoanaerobaculia bacterium]